MRGEKRGRESRWWEWGKAVPALWGRGEREGRAAGREREGEGEKEQRGTESSEREMIKIISYVVIAFCHRKANILRRWSTVSTGTKACVTAADLIDSDENLHCFTLPLSSCYIKISIVSQYRCTAEILWLFNISTHSLSCFF